MDNEIKEILKGLSWNLHQNNKRLDNIRHLLEDIAGLLHESNKNK